LILRSKPPAPEKQPELQRHIEPRKICAGIQGDSGNVMDSKPALLDHSFDLREAKISRIVLLQRTAWDETEVIYSEDDRVEYRPVAKVERAVDEDVITS